MTNIINIDSAKELISLSLDPNASITASSDMAKEAYYLLLDELDDTQEDDDIVRIVKTYKKINASASRIAIACNDERIRGRLERLARSTDEIKAQLLVCKKLMTKEQLTEMARAIRAGWQDGIW